MMRSLIASAVLLLSAGAFAAEPPRFALVVAAAPDGALGAAVAANAEKAAGALRSSGFDVEVRADLDAAALRRAVRDFSARVESTRGEAQGVLYLAASVMQAGARNYILPRGSDVARPSDIPIEGVAVADLLTALAAVPAKGRLLAVDAVRGAEMTGVEPGLAAVPAPDGTFVMLSAKPGQTLPGVDGAGRFAAAFAGALAGGGDSDAVFERIRDQVVRDSGGAQEPMRESGLGAPFAFGKPSAPAVAEAAQPSAPPSPPPEPAAASASSDQPAAAPANAPPAPGTQAVAAAQPAVPPPPAPSAPIVKLPARDALPSPDGAPSPGASIAPPADAPEAVAPPAAIPVPQNKPRPPPRPRVASADPNQGIARPGFEPANRSFAPRNSFGEGGIGRPSEPSTDPGYLVYLGPQAAYRLVTQRNTLQAYGAFVRAYPNHPLSADIRARVSAAPNPGRAAVQGPVRPPGPSPFAQPRFGFGYPPPPGIQ